MDDVRENAANPTFADAEYGYDVTGSSSAAAITWSSANATNRSVEELLEAYLGARHRNMAECVVLTVVYAAIFLTGLIGNVCTCVVIIKNAYMHTATNYYLFSLAISDVMTLILGLPPELYTIWEAYPWRLGTPYCLFKTFLTEMTSSASVLTIAAFTVERYVAICHPIKSQTMSTLSRAIRIILGVWISAALSALPYPLHTRTYHYVVDPETNRPIPDSLICNIRPEWLPHMRYVFQVSTFLLFIIPMGLITYLYALIGMTLRRSEITRQASENTGSSPHSQPRRAILKMLVAVVVAFFICWAPFHSQRLMTVYISDDEWTPTLLEVQSLLFYVSGVLYFVSSTVNPILYNLMSKKYRQAFKDTLCGCFLPSTIRGRRFKRQMGANYDRSGTCEMYTQATCTRYTPSRQTVVQCSPLISASCRSLAKQFSDISEDEVAGRDPDLRPDPDSVERRGHWSVEGKDQSCGAANGRYRIRTPVNGAVCGGDAQVEGRGRDASDDIEMTAIGGDQRS